MQLNECMLVEHQPHCAYCPLGARTALSQEHVSHQWFLVVNQHKEHPPSSKSLAPPTKNPFTHPRERISTGEGIEVLMPPTQLHGRGAHAIAAVEVVVWIPVSIS